MPRILPLEDALHHADDPGCPACAEGFPEPCACGGLMHATGIGDGEEPDLPPVTRCDACGRSKDDLDEEQQIA